MEKLCQLFPDIDDPFEYALEEEWREDVDPETEYEEICEVFPQDTNGDNSQRVVTLPQPPKDMQQPLSINDVDVRNFSFVHLENINFGFLFSIVVISFLGWSLGSV